MRTQKSAKWAIYQLSARENSVTLRSSSAASQRTYLVAKLLRIFSTPGMGVICSSSRTSVLAVIANRLGEFHLEFANYVKPLLRHT